ncbi:pyridine nucleotide-disulfide oxidoreductase [Hirsutella rhossiliensis]|uniref:Nitrite reductase [NAD(P)H] n=1 Tax=Hirsutella rhossiliensis TaxID=111463 RepID=A0A9P8SK94_9HYPO|nr:pyridine nucleotide-disulfide oxidoreductase domain-containing protein [Hirsutella rhossiliensis]KAH0963891.1 pyridine nucleotide-disulfide oxidoreductase domain-containing protein [Hirsutella rhossiliensis]
MSSRPSNERPCSDASSASASERPPATQSTTPAPDGLVPKKKKKRAAVVGLGMVGISFVEKLLKHDLRSGCDEWEVTVFGEEAHVAYNRVGLTQYFTNRSVEDLYLNPVEWYLSHADGKLTHHTSSPVVSIDADARSLTTAEGLEYSYNECILATGSVAALPPYLSEERFFQTKGSFVYRTIKDLDGIMAYAVGAPNTLGHGIRKAAVIGGGLLGLEAAKALLDLDGVDRVILVERNRWVLSRQLDREGGLLVLDKVNALGAEVLLEARVRDILCNDDGVLTGLLLQGKDEQPDQPYDIDMLVFAIGINPRDELAKTTPLAVSKRGGGFIVDGQLRTNLPNIYAIGECANFLGQTFGLIAPGVEMAEVLAFNLTEGRHHKLRDMKPPDVSTKLKLMGVDVASFGDFFADQGNISRPFPATSGSCKGESLIPAPEHVKERVKALTYRDPFSDVYKKYIFTSDGKYILGGMMVGDVRDFVKLVALCNRGAPIDKPPAEFIIGAKKEGENEGDDLPDDAQICSCHNVTKGDVVRGVKAGGIRSLGELKSSTKCGTGCGGCVPLATSILRGALKDAGVEISNHLCKDFACSRQELYQIAKFKRLKDFARVMRTAGKKPDSLGCEVCRPAVGSILSSLYNEWIMRPLLRQTQDTNDRYLANVQRDGTYSVVPRLPAGEVTPAGLKAIGEIASEFGLYTKITGGQRIDMFGAKKQDLPRIWEKLVHAGFESGHAYGKALRTVKSCVGSTWCRFGVGDSVGLAVELEHRYKGLRAPHKLKGGVSGCVRECAEAQGKDFGLIATPKGWNVFVGGNGGAKPRHAELIAEHVTRREAIKILDRFLIFYIRSADKLERTARWIERYPGGVKGLQHVIVGDKLGICAELEQEMEALVGLYHCEWANVVNHPERQRAFNQFANTDETQNASERVTERRQQRPADWPADSAPLHFSVLDVAKDARWDWRRVCKLSDLDRQADAPTSITVKYGHVQLAVWNIPGRGLRAAQNMCPHRKAFVLADGLVGEDELGREYISCPLHKRNFLLGASATQGGGRCSDSAYSIMTFEAKADEGEDVLLRLPPTDVLDAVLSTTRWMLRKATEETDMLAQGPGHSVEIATPLPADKMKGHNIGGGTSSQTSALDW